MGKRKCDSCGNDIEKETEHSLSVPEEPCKHCDSERYAEYFFCSKGCVQEWLGRN